MPGELFEAPPDRDDDNITDWCLGEFRSAYRTESITKDDIWEYLYGVMHAPDWRERYRNDLQKNLPRVPLAEDFEAFRAAGRELMDLHAGYETCPEYESIAVELADPMPGKKRPRMWNRLTDGQAIERAREDDGAVFRIADRMRWNRVRDRSTGKLVVDKKVLYINKRCRLTGIPVEADLYTVSGRSPLDWAIASVRRKKDKKSGIVDDPNRWHGWADDAFGLVRHLRRLAYLSVRSAEIIKSLPPSLDGPIGPDSERKPVSRKRDDFGRHDESAGCAAVSGRGPLVS